MPGLNADYVLHEIDLLRMQFPDIWGDDETLLADMLEAETGLNDFLSRVVKHMLETQAEAGGLGQYIDDLKVRREKKEQRVVALRALALKLLEHANLPNLKLDEASLSVRHGPPKVIITDEDALPGHFMRIKREPNKGRIKEHLEAGQTVPGATLSNSEPFLTVRIK
jgi:hypothetical protein